MKKSKLDIFGRLGNKTNDIKFFKHLLPTESINIVEPFGGTFAVIKNIYSDEKYNLFVNDTDKQLYEVYTNIDEFIKFKIFINDIAGSCYDNEKKQVDFKLFKSKLTEDVKGHKFYDFIIKTIINRGMIVKYLKTLNVHIFNTDIYKRITFTNVNYIEVFNTHKYDENCFLFLDPPYLFCDNSSYQDQLDGTDTSIILVDILKMFNDVDVKCKIMLIINSLEIIKYLFRGFIKSEYQRIYQLSKKKEQHLIICNY